MHGLLDPTRLAPRLSRRRFLEAALAAALGAGVGGLGLALAGCGGDDDATLNDASLPASGATRPDGQRRASIGGRYRTPLALDSLDFFDIHRALLPQTQRFAALQQNRLVRYATPSTGELEADLATLPEIPDDETYIFELRRDVTWWDRFPMLGRPLTADDIRANIDRQIAGLDAAGREDPLFRRQRDYARTASLQVIDDFTLVFRTDGPEATYLARAHAGPWSFIQAPEIWDAYGDRLRDDPLNTDYFSGTGPFMVEAFTPGQSIAFRRNPAYFRTDQPYLDALEFVHLVDPAEQEAAYREGRLLTWSTGDAAAVAALARELDGHSVAERPLPYTIALRFIFRDTAADNPFLDVRLARAVHLAIDRDAIARVAYGGFGAVAGPVPGFIPEWSMAEPDLRRLPGYRSDKEADWEQARALVSAVGWSDPLRLLMPDVMEATHPGLAAQIERALTTGLDLPVSVVLQPYNAAVQALTAGSDFAVIDWSEPITDADPTADLLDRIHSQGARNLGGYRNPAVDAALERMRIMLDPQERRRIYKESVEPPLLADPAWMVNLAQGVQRSLSWPGVHLPRFDFGWDWHKAEHLWLDARAPQLPDVPRR